MLFLASNISSELSSDEEPLQTTLFLQHHDGFPLNNENNREKYNGTSNSDHETITPFPGTVIRDLQENTTSKENDTSQSFNVDDENNTPTNYDVTIQVALSQLTTSSASSVTETAPLSSTSGSATSLSPSIQQQSTEARSDIDEEFLCNQYHDRISAFSFDVLSSARSAVLHYVG